MAISPAKTYQAASYIGLNPSKKFLRSSRYVNQSHCCSNDKRKQYSCNDIGYDRQNPDGAEKPYSHRNFFSMPVLLVKHWCIVVWIP